MEVVLDEVRGGDLFHEDDVRLHEKMIGLGGQADRDVVVGHVDEDEVRDQAVGGGELAAQLPFLRAHSLAGRAPRLPDLDDVAFHVRFILAAMSVSPAFAQTHP